MKRILLALLLAVPFVGGSASASSDLTAPEQLFEAKCSVCHATSRPLGKNKDRAGWESTVKRMQGKRPGHITDAEAASIIAV